MSTITKAFIIYNEIGYEWRKYHIYKSVEQGNIEALHGATLTTESDLRCSMCQAPLIDSDKPPMYIWRLRVTGVLPFCFTLGQVCFWMNLLLWYPFSFSTGLTVNEERLCILYISKSWQLPICGPPSGATGCLGTDLFACGFSIAIHCISWCVPINGAVNIQTELENVHQVDLTIPLLYHGKLYGGI